MRFKAFVAALALFATASLADTVEIGSGFQSINGITAGGTGTITLAAPDIPYSPFVPGSWSPVPTQTASALDQLVARLLSAGATIGGAVTGGTTGSVLFVGAGPVLAQDNANLFWNNTTKRLGVGTVAPDSPLDVESAGGTVLGHFSGASATAATPLAIKNTNTTDGNSVSIIFQGKDAGGTDNYRTGSIASIVTDHTAGALKADMSFQTRPAVGGSTERMRILSSGEVGIGTTTPHEALEVAGNFRLPATTSTVGQIKLGSSLFLHAYGSSNLFLGIGAGNVTLTGDRNTFVGANSGANCTTCDRNTFIGDNPSTAATTSSSVGIGDQVTIGATVGSIVIGSSGVAGGGDDIVIGRAASVTGDSGVSIGQSSLTDTGIAIGLNARANGSGGISIGGNAAHNEVSAGTTIAIGQNALMAVNGGGLNTAVGHAAGNSASTAYRLAIFGYDAGGGITTGQETSILGGFGGAGLTSAVALTTGRDDTLIGFGADVDSVARSYATCLGASCITAARDNSVTLGRAADIVYAPNLVGIGTAAPLAALDVQTDVTAAAGVARGVNVQQTLHATADNDVLTAVRIAPTFDQGAFAGVKNVGLSVTAGAFVGIGTATPLAPLDMSSNPTAIRLGPQGVLYGSVQANDYIDPFNGIWSTPGGGHIFKDPTGAATWAGPTAAGVANSVLQNDGTGTTTWVQPTRTVGTPAAAGSCTKACAAGVAVGGGCTHSAALALQNSYPSSATVWSCDYIGYAAIGNCTAYVICQ